jgi:urease accessory protein
MTERELKNHFVMAWLSPACPIGAFAYSQGLEAAVEDGLVTDISSLKVWLNASLSHGSIKNDSVFLAAAFNSKSLSELQNLTDLYYAFCISSSRYQESKNMGRAFSKLVTLKNEYAFPISLGKVSKDLGIKLDNLIPLFMHSALQNQISAAQRLISLGQSDAFKLLTSLFALIGEIAQEVRTGELDNLTSTSFIAEIEAMRHETLNTRIFAS